MQECSPLSGAAQVEMESVGLERDLALAGSLQPISDIMVCVCQMPLKQSGLEHWIFKERTVRSGYVQPFGKGRARRRIAILRY